MKVIHPKTKSTLIMNEGSHFIAEVEGPDADNPEFVSVTIGVIGNSTALIIYKEDWAAFKQLVAEIDAEWV